MEEVHLKKQRNEFNSEQSFFGVVLIQSFWLGWGEGQEITYLRIDVPIR